MKSSFYILNVEDVRMSLYDVGGILRILSFIMLLPLAATIHYSWGVGFWIKLWDCLAFMIPSLMLWTGYFFLRRFGVKKPSKNKHIMLTIALSWLIMAFVGSVPFIWRGALNPFDSFFESMSGWTTTGFTMLSDFGGTDMDLLIYRSVMQGVGGLGVISLGMMVLLQGGNMGAGYYDLGVWKIKPGIRQALREAWKIYALYIIAGAILLYIAGLTGADAVSHSITAVATGGFSTHPDVGYFENPVVEGVLLILMTLGMTSFIIHYRLFNGDYKGLAGDEFKYLVIIVGISIIAVSFSLYGRPIDDFDTFNPIMVFRKAGFHVISGISTCGFNTADLSIWPDFAKTWITGLMYIGGMSSSTAGGIRVIRFLIILKAVNYVFRRHILPKRAIVMMKVDGKALVEDLIAVTGYAAAYLFVGLMLSLALMAHGYNSIDSLFTIMSAMGNDGLNVISGTSWYDMAWTAKMAVIAGMWIGRIEIFPGLLILKNLYDSLS
jgi:trk system potassium uptake protein